MPPQTLQSIFTLSPTVPHTTAHWDNVLTKRWSKQQDWHVRPSAQNTVYWSAVVGTTTHTQCEINVAATATNDDKKAEGEK
jgi:hypothetical protein